MAQSSSSGPGHRAAQALLGPDAKALGLERPRPPARRQSGPLPGALLNEPGVWPKVLRRDQRRQAARALRDLTQALGLERPRPPTSAAAWGCPGAVLQDPGVGPEVLRRDQRRQAAPALLGPDAKALGLERPRPPTRRHRGGWPPGAVLQGLALARSSSSGPMTASCSSATGTWRKGAGPGATTAAASRDGGASSRQRSARLLARHRNHIPAVVVPGHNGARYGALRYLDPPPRRGSFTASWVAPSVVVPTRRWALLAAWLCRRRRCGTGAARTSLTVTSATTASRPTSAPTGPAAARARSACARSAICSTSRGLLRDGDRDPVSGYPDRPGGEGPHPGLCGLRAARRPDLGLLRMGIAGAV